MRKIWILSFTLLFFSSLCAQLPGTVNGSLLDSAHLPIARAGNPATGGRLGADVK